MTEREDILKEFGQKLTERREAAGLTLESVFDRTKIRPEYLRGLEEGNYDGFPEVVYIKGFLRTYLNLVGWDKEFYEEFAACLDSKDGTHSKKQPQPQGKNMNKILGNGSSMPKGFKPASHFWLFLVLVAALLGTGAYVWYAVTYGGLDIKNMDFFKFSGAGGPLASNTSSDNVAVEVEESIESVTVSDDVSEDEEPEEPVTPFLEIHAVNDVWLSVTLGNGQPIFRRTLKRGESQRWDLTAPARVVFGRPSAAQVIHNGQDLGIVNPSAKKSETYIYNADGTARRANSR